MQRTLGPLGAVSTAMTARDFLLRVAEALSCPPAIRQEGASHLLTRHSATHSIEILCAESSGFSLTTSLRWPTFPREHVLDFAPVGYYARAKWTEEGFEPPPTGDPDFDDTFLIWSSGPSNVSCVTPVVRETLLRYTALRPTFSSCPEVRIAQGGAQLVHPEPEHVRLRCRPDERADPDQSIFVPIGTQRFTPAYAVEMLKHLDGLLNGLRGIT